MTLPDDDGRKFDVRSHILVANVDPLVVFTGAEMIRICVEPMNATNPKQYPGIHANSSWNPFQQVCNGGIGKKHPTKPGIWSVANHTGMGPLEKGIHDDEVRSRVLSNIDQINYALVELLHQRWEGKVGMFQLLAADYVVDNSEKIWLLELNNQPGFFMLDEANVTFPNPWGDIFEIEWTILETYNNNNNNNNQQHRRHYAGDDDDDGRNDGGEGSSDDDGTTHHNSASTWKRILQKRLSELELETLRMMPPLWSS